MIHKLWGLLGTVFRLVPRLRHTLTRLRGQQREGGRQLTIIFTDATERFRDYLAQMTFSDVLDRERLGHLWHWKNFTQHARVSSADILVIGDVPRVPNGGSTGHPEIFFPRWVFGEFDLETALSRMVTSSELKQRIRKIRTDDLRREVTRDPARIYDFYHAMHLPYVRQRYGEAGSPILPNVLKKNIDRLELILVRQGPVFLAGALLFYENVGEVTGLAIGLKDGDPVLLRTGAGSAIYYYSILHLAEKGFKTLKCGWSRTFLHDGVLRYKKSWSLRIVDTHNIGSLLVALNDSPQTRMFFQSVPLIGVTDNKLTGILFVRQEDVKSALKLIELHRRYFIAGMDRLRVLVSGDSATHPAVPDKLAGELTIESADDFFRGLPPGPA